MLCDVALVLYKQSYKRYEIQLVDDEYGVHWRKIMGVQVWQRLLEGLGHILPTCSSKTGVI